MEKRREGGGKSDESVAYSDYQKHSHCIILFFAYLKCLNPENDFPLSAVVDSITLGYLNKYIVNEIRLVKNNFCVVTIYLAKVTRLENRPSD